MASNQTAAIDFEVNSEWRKCIFRDYDRHKRNRSAVQYSRNNSSMVMSHANYLAPQIQPDLQTTDDPMAKLNFESNLRPQTFGVFLSLCIRKHNYENYLWQFVHNGLFSGAKAYQNLYLWTVMLKVRMNRRVPLGCLMRGLQSRLGLQFSDSLKFCLDGFYGMPGCGDIFGSQGIDVVPWMEVSSRSTPDSLNLKNGDILFVSYSNEKLESMARARKQNLVALAHQSSNRSESPKPKSANNPEQLTRRQVTPQVTHNALPLAGMLQPPMLHRAGKLSRPNPQHLVRSTYPGEPLHVAAVTSVNSQFSLAIINPSDKEFDNETLDMSDIFTADGAEIRPGTLDRLLHLQSELGDLFRVRYPGCGSGLGLAMSPDLLARLLNGADATSTGCGASAIVCSLRGRTRSRVFKFDLQSPLASACADAIGAGVKDELRRFAVELDARLTTHCGSRTEVWQVAGADFFVVDTFFAAAVASIYGIEREHRFQAYTVDSTLLCIDEWLAFTDLEPNAPCDYRLSRAWDLLYALHPSVQELASVEPCRHLERLKDTFLRTNETWRNFVGYSVSLLNEDYNAKKAAFWSIIYLVQHRTVYENLLAEIEGVAVTTSQAASNFTRLTLKSIEEMSFLEAFVKEVYRHTSGQFIKFQANANLILQARETVGFKYRKGSQIAVLLRSLNMNPTYFHQPEAFCPQRFLPSSQDARLHCLPFGAMTPRRRVGLLKLKIFLILLLTRCSLSPHGPPAELNSRLYGLDVLPRVEDASFQYKLREH